MRRPSLHLCVLLVLCSAAAASDLEPSLITDTIRSDHGHFALSIDPATKTVLVIRSDERAGASPQLRVRIRSLGKTREITLKAVSRGDSPLRYQGEDQGWDGSLQGWDLEFSHDGRHWDRVQPARKK